MYKIPFRKCQVADFEKRGLVVSKELKGTYEKRLCPDINDENQDLFKVMNGYAN